MLDWGSKVATFVVQDSLSTESLYCILKQDTLSTAKYLFNPGRQEIALHE